MITFRLRIKLGNFRKMFELLNGIESESMYKHLNAVWLYRLMSIEDLGGRVVYMHTWFIHITRGRTDSGLEIDSKTPLSCCSVDGENGAIRKRSPEWIHSKTPFSCCSVDGQLSMSFRYEVSVFKRKRISVDVALVVRCAEMYF